MSRIEVGEVVKLDEQPSIHGDSVTVPDPDRLVHLQFRRFAGCPICNLHLRAVTRRHGEIDRAGIHEVAVFHSTAESMRRYQGELPFPAIADPDKTLYARFGVESSPKLVLHPRAWAAYARGVARQRTRPLRARFRRLTGDVRTDEGVDHVEPDCRLRAVVGLRFGRAGQQPRLGGLAVRATVRQSRPVR